MRSDNFLFLQPCFSWLPPWLSTVRLYLSGTAKTDPFLLWVAFGHGILSQEQESHTYFPHSDRAFLGRDEDQAGEQRRGLVHFGEEVRHQGIRDWQPHFQTVLPSCYEWILWRQRRRKNDLKQIRYILKILKKKKVSKYWDIYYSSFHVCPSEPYKLNHTSKNHRNDDKSVGFRIYIRLKKSSEILMESTSLGWDFSGIWAPVACVRIENMTFN